MRTPNELTAHNINSRYRVSIPSLLRFSRVGQLVRMEPSKRFRDSFEDGVSFLFGYLVLDPGSCWGRSLQRSPSSSSSCLPRGASHFPNHALDFILRELSPDFGESNLVLFSGCSVCCRHIDSSSHAHLGTLERLPQSDYSGDCKHRNLGCDAGPISIGRGSNVEWRGFCGSSRKTNLGSSNGRCGVPSWKLLSRPNRQMRCLDVI